MEEPQEHHVGLYDGHLKLQITFESHHSETELTKSLYKVDSALVYQKFGFILETRALKEGVGVIVVNPAFTCFIGKLKYLNQIKKSVHQAAGLVIARRGMGLKDRLPSQSVVPVMRRPCTF